jgi:hypothetical protein
MIGVTINRVLQMGQLATISQSQGGLGYTLLPEHRSPLGQGAQTAHDHR